MMLLAVALQVTLGQIYPMAQAYETDPKAVYVCTLLDNAGHQVFSHTDPTIDPPMGYRPDCQYETADLPAGTYVAAIEVDATAIKNADGSNRLLALSYDRYTVSHP